uniref:Uncharacterized protein n=1 Tax=Prorocentrum micans TaxID=2945 RepID=A0A7S2TD43_PROMC|mmetsp:Transcript_15776/g.12641  ORF Transcript_15776/g.12641 Transcript_15776/m.12641 type:complete len:145 (+) Transcript_15776:147-581(+)
MPRGLHVGCGSLRMYHGRMLLLSLAHHSGTRQSHLSQNGYGRSLRNGMTVFFFFFFFFSRLRAMLMSIHKCFIQGKALSQRAEASTAQMRYPDQRALVGDASRLTCWLWIPSHVPWAHAITELSTSLRNASEPLEPKWLRTLAT